MADQVRVALVPKGKAFLVAGDSGLLIDVPNVLREPWLITLESIIEVTWFSSTRAVFRAQHGHADQPDASPAVVDLCAGDPDARLRFRRPLGVPFRRRQTLWPRTVLMWAPPNPRSPRVIVPPPLVRHGLATSLAIRASGDPLELKVVLEAAGVQFPEYGDPT